MPKKPLFLSLTRFDISVLARILESFFLYIITVWFHMLSPAHLGLSTMCTNWSLATPLHFAFSDENLE